MEIAAVVVLAVLALAGLLGAVLRIAIPCLIVVMTLLLFAVLFTVAVVLDVLQ